MAPTELVYIAGSAHGGSTLLDLLISGHSAIFSLGEVNFLRARGAPRCSCGVSEHAECPFWSAVDRELRAHHKTSLAALDPNAPDERSFERHNRALFEAASTVSGASVLLDSSKSPRRLARLLEADVLRVRPIHLVRSPYGVVYSYAKRGKSVGKPARVYAREHLSILETLRGVDHLRVQYEELSTTPEPVLRRVMEWIGLPFEPEQMDWRAGDRHNWGGNGMRFSGDASIRPDVAWKEGLNAWQKLYVRFATLPIRSMDRPPLQR